MCGKILGIMMYHVKGAVASPIRRQQIFLDFADVCISSLRHVAHITTCSHLLDPRCGLEWPICPSAHEHPAGSFYCLLVQWFTELGAGHRSGRR